MSCQGVQSTTDSQTSLLSLARPENMVPGVVILVAQSIAKEPFAVGDQASCVRTSRVKNTTSDTIHMYLPAVWYALSGIHESRRRASPL